MSFVVSFDDFCHFAIRHLYRKVSIGRKAKFAKK